MTAPKLTKEDVRAVEAATAGILAVRLAQCVAGFFALSNAWHGDWKGAFILAVLAACLSLFLPRVDPALMRRLEEAGKPD